MKSGVIICILSITVTIIGYTYIPWLPYTYTAGFDAGREHKNDSITQLRNRTRELELDLRALGMELKEEERDHSNTRGKMDETIIISEETNLELDKLKLSFLTTRDSLSQVRISKNACDRRLGNTQRAIQNLQTETVIKDSLLELQGYKIDSLSVLMDKASDTLIKVRSALGDTIQSLNRVRQLRDTAEVYAHKMRKLFQAQQIQKVSSQRNSSALMVQQSTVFTDSIETTIQQTEEEYSKDNKWQLKTLGILSVIVVVIILLIVRRRNKRFRKKVHRTASSTIINQGELPKKKKSLPGDLFFKKKST